MEDFRYSPERGFFNGYVMTGMSVMDGEVLIHGFAKSKVKGDPNSKSD